MTDTEILDEIRNCLRTWGSTQLPVSPAQAIRFAEWIDKQRGQERYAVYGMDPKTPLGLVPDGNIKQGVANPTYQKFWRCAHHPEAIANWSHGTGWHCEHGCDLNLLRWCDNGTLFAEAVVPRETIAKADVSHLRVSCNRQWPE